jgi:hypothetical protein
LPKHNGLSLRLKGLLTQTPPLEFNIHPYRSGDYILIKTWKEEKLRPTWERPFQVLITTKTAECIADKGWTHYIRVKCLSKDVGPLPTTQKIT